MAEDKSKHQRRTTERRIANLNNHLLPTPFPFSKTLQIRPSPASAEDSYRRIHGDVSAEAATWNPISVDSVKDFTDILYEKAMGEGIAKISINRPERRNAFRPHTIKELISAFNDARDDSSIGVIILTGKGTKAFCSGGDQALRTSDGYADFESFGRLNVLDLQTGPKVGSFDAGYGSSIMSRLVGPKKAKEMWFLSRFYSAYEAEKMGLVNAVVKLENLELETLKWCREILRNSPTTIRVLKSALNAVDDGHAGLQDLGGNATYIFYGTEEANEGKRAYMERRRPDYSKFPRRP